ncbi:MAG TPA: serine protease [Trichocoleus sp.]
MGNRQFEPSRAVEVIFPHYGSAYRIGGRLVLTAAHLLSEVGSVCHIRSKQSLGKVDAKVVWKDQQSEIALVELPEEIAFDEAIVFGKLPEARSGEVLPFQMYGYPLWGRTQREGGRTAAGGRQIEGKIYLADTSPDGLLVLEAHRVPKQYLSDSDNVWLGISGAAVVCDGLVIAVQIQIPNPRHLEILEASPLSKVYTNSKWCALLKQHGINSEPTAYYQRHNNFSINSIVRSIEFPPEYKEAGTSILTYFSHILKVYYPDTNIKVSIEQEGLMLRMIIDTPSGQRERIERTLEEYGMVVTGKLRPEAFLNDPFEVIALKNKLEIADLELRQTRKLLEFTRDNSQQRIESLEVQVNKLHSIIEKGLQSGDHVFEVMRKMSEQDKSTYNLSHAKFGGGFAAEGGHQEGGQFNDYSIQVGANIDEIAELIQSLKTAIQTFPEEQRVDIGIEIEDLQTDLSDEQRRNPERLGKRVRSLWLITCAIAVGVAGVADFSNNLLELSEKLNVPIPIELIQQNPHILPGS